MSTSGARWMARVAEVGCVICAELGHGFVPAEVHHVAEGSGLRYDEATAGLCPEHHRGGSGIHGMGVKAFCALYRIPGECEWGLLVLVNKWMARRGHP